MSSEEKKQELLRDAQYLDHMRKDFDRRQAEWMAKMTEYLQEKGEIE